MLKIYESLQAYALAHQGAFNIQKEAEKQAGEQYIGARYAQEIGKIKDTFEATIFPLRDKYLADMKSAFEQARADIQNVVSKPVDAELVSTINIMRSLPNVTQTEKESVLARCADNYLATRLCIDRLQLEGAHLPPKVDDVLEALDKLHATIRTFFDSTSYGDDAGYTTRLVLEGSYVKSNIGEATTFIDTFK